ncbi:MAG: hypothetical protein ACR5LG_01035 [Sodalis sp. (in: enterobacteria)]|uniref:hypothetical protein n=1 Tax=Sodalis sp. (in: enterobacteria) TaxID=1898979 RepID=UPI003F36EA29
MTAGMARIDSREFNNSGCCLQTDGDLHIDTNDQRLTNIYNSYADILSGGNLTLNAGDINNVAGHISAAGECRVNSGALLNAGGRLQSGDHLQLNAHGQRLNNAHSRNAGILSGGNLWLNAGEIDNTSGLMAAAGETRVSSAVLNNLDGRFISGPGLVLLLPSLNPTSGRPGGGANEPSQGVHPPQKRKTPG